MLCQYYFDLPPLQAEQLLWCRFVNTHGIRGRNIPLDLHQEHLNRLLKDIIKGIGANKTEEALVRSSKALGTLHNMLSQFDKDNHLDNTSEVHRPPSCKRELNTIIKELKTHQVLNLLMAEHTKPFLSQDASYSLEKKSRSG